MTRGIGVEKNFVKKSNHLVRNCSLGAKYGSAKYYNLYWIGTSAVDSSNNLFEGFEARIRLELLNSEQNAKYQSGNGSLNLHTSESNAKYFFVLNIQFYKMKDLRHYVRATLLKYEDDTTECRRP